MTFEEYWAKAEKPSGIIGRQDGPIALAFEKVAREAWIAALFNVNKNYEVIDASNRQ